MLRTSMSCPRLDSSGIAALEGHWRAFAAKTQASFFQDWTWVGCMAAERFPDPVLLEIFQDEALVAMALFNRRVSVLKGDALYLLETDDPVLDSIFTEHNGPLILSESGRVYEAFLARVLQDNATHVSTKSFGTVAYMPAEVLQHNRMSRGADVYSFAMIMWELLAGRRVYDGYIATQAWRLHLESLWRLWPWSMWRRWLGWT